jgi:hypothetical protein
MFKINSLTPQPISTKFGVATIQNPATNISLEFFHFILNPEQRRVFQLVVNIIQLKSLVFPPPIWRRKV